MPETELVLRSRELTLGFGMASARSSSAAACPAYSSTFYGGAASRSRQQDGLHFLRRWVYARHGEPELSSGHHWNGHSLPTRGDKQRRAVEISVEG